MLLHPRTQRHVRDASLGIRDICVAPDARGRRNICATHLHLRIEAMRQVTVINVSWELRTAQLAECNRRPSGYGNPQEAPWK